MSTWKIPGQKQPPVSEPSALQPGSFGKEVSVETTDLIHVGALRADEKPVVLDDVADDDLLEIELEGGVKQWILAEQFRRDFLEGPYATRDATASASKDELTIDPHLRIGAQTRGVASWTLKTVRRLKVKIAGTVLDQVDAPGILASKLCAQLEKRFMPDPGFKHWDGGKKLRSADASAIEPDKPTLVFIHGTFSSTIGSFGDIGADEKTWKDLSERYGGRIFALDHHTLGASPIDNAIDLVDALPENARIHLVSHSRGGMVGELICRAQRLADEPFDELDLKAILGDPDEDRPDREKQRDRLRELNNLLKKRSPRIERFVRVAAPAAGTSLAGDRFDRWLSILLNALQLTPTLAAGPIFGLVSSFAAAVIKKRLDPGCFPGIEAMRPGSPLVRLLNRPDVTTAADLAVIAGDLEGAGVWGSVKAFVTDLVYGGDHDVVVNTLSMYGGAQRSNGVYFFDHGAQVDHFHYFSNDRTAKKLREGLAAGGDDTAVFAQRKRDGFADLEEKRAALEAKEGRLIDALNRGERQVQSKPVVFVLPGIMGSALAQDEKDIWVNPLRLALGQMSRLRIDSQLVRPTKLLAGPYGDLIEHLSVDHAVQAFPYDWRLSLLTEARRLAAEIRKTLDATEQPVRLLAHSLGGLLARVMFAEDPELWERFKGRKDSRLVMLGTPNAGSFKIVRVLLGRDKLLRILSLVDLANSKRETVEIVSQFPGILELLPEHSNDYFQPDAWESLAGAVGASWPFPKKPDLGEARRVRDLLAKSPLDRDRMFYVAGIADETPVGVDLKGGRLRFLATRRGDGSVPWDGGVLPALKTWYMDAEHGKLADHGPSFQALSELLAGGETGLLATTPPALDRAADAAPFEMTEPAIESYPDELELQAAAVGFSPVREDPKPVEPIKLSVYHGDLAFVNCPIIAGHHDGDAILGAERALDQKLGGRLSDRRALGLYAGKIGSSEIVLDDPPTDGQCRRRDGAVIVGLGSIGRLLPSGLEASVADGALRYALHLVEERKALSDGGEPEGVFEASLCSLVVGSEFGGLTAAESMGAILNGVLRANDALARQKDLANWVRIGNLQFIELYRDRAIQAAEILLRLRDDEGLKRRVLVVDELQEGESGRSRVPPNEGASWWHRIQVADGCVDGALSFTTMTGRARADINVLPLQLKNVQRFVQSSVTRVRWDSKVANTLFHLLLPNDLKPMALEERNLVLLLGTKAAAYPWELLHDQTSPESTPLVTRGGLIRQLATEERGRPFVDSMAESALVVGDPKTHLPRLRGAEEEAGKVADQLQAAGLEVTRQIRSGADAIQMALFSKPYQVLHLAGHGVIDKELDENTVHDPNRTNGMVIGEELYLTPSIIRQLPQVPELVFINCCHLGSMATEKDRKFHLLAANLGAQFIRDGVSAVVAAGWAVDDAAAATFADEFYQRMLDGEQFGDAVKFARKLAYKRHPGVNTFGAYQCYGDPSYRLRIRGLRGGSSQRETAYVSPDHAAHEFDSIRHSVKASNSTDTGWARDRIRRLDEWVALHRKNWLSSSAILNAAIGEAYSEVEMFEEAFAAYGRALKAEKADAPLRILEQRGSLQVKIGEAGMEADPEEGLALIRLGIEQLEAVLAAGETAERHSLVGSAYGRLHIRRPRKAKGELNRMAEHFSKAYQLKLGRGDLDLAYPLINWISAELGRNSDRKPLKHVELNGEKFDVLMAIDDAVRKARLAAESEPTFWTEITPTDCRLLQSLCSGKVLDDADEIEAAYRALRLGSPKQRTSAADGVRLHIELLQARPKSDQDPKLIAALKRLARAVERS